MENNALSALPSQPPPMALSPKAAAAIDRGDLIAAIKLLREHTGLGLKESKDAVDRYLAGDRFPLSAGPAAATPGFPAAQSGVSFAGYAFPTSALAAMREGNKIEAIKLLRDAYKSLGLAEAKDLIDAYAEQQSPSRDSFADDPHRGLPNGDAMAEPGRVPHKPWRASLLWIAALLLAAFAFWTFFARS